MTASQLLVWALLVGSVTGLGHYYVWRRLVRDASLPRPWHRALTVALSALAVGLPLTMILGRQLPREAVSWLAVMAFLWMGILSNLFWFLVLTEPGRLFLLSWKRRSDSAPENAARRQIFKRGLAAGVAFAGASFSGLGVARALGPFQITELDVTLKRLPRAFDGYRIVQVSDIHVGPTIGRPFIEAMVEEVNRLGADLVAITGDLVDGSVASLRHHTEPLRDLRATDGTYFVTGNHEYYSGADDWVMELERLGIVTLKNSRVELARGDARIDLAGVTDYRAAPYGDAPDLALALEGRDPNRELILLAHQPAELENARKHGVGLQLSGHTHGGQFWPWTLVVAMIQPVVRGLARFGDTQVYVNTGTGYWGPPLRTGNAPEITLVRLRAPSVDRAP